MTREQVPEFAVIGHPNEGKSSVVSTLSEDDTVRIGPMPGETTRCRTHPVVIDGQEVIRFVDTPGFQNPRQTLAWMEQYRGAGDLIVQDFIAAHEKDPDFRDECELLRPVARGAGIIYVVDGSRPLRRVDRIEMEILRLTARPRMAVINTKGEDTRYLELWKTEFRRQFNAIRRFNAHKATYAERLELLESLKRVEEDWQPALDLVIEVFRREWNQRILFTAGVICDMVREMLCLTLTRSLGKGRDENTVRQTLQDDHRRKIIAMEKRAHQQIKKCYKHNIFNLTLPPDNIVHENLFSEKTWRFLGLSSRELVLAAGVAGGAAGAALDVAAAGLTFGIFSTIGGLMGAGSAALSGRRMAGLTFKGVRLGRDQIRMGPPGTVQFLYVVLDRALIYYSSVINWAHGRRDAADHRTAAVVGQLKKGYSAYWDSRDKKICRDYFDAVTGRKKRHLDKKTKAFQRFLERELLRLART